MVIDLVYLCIARFGNLLGRNGEKDTIHRIMAGQSANNESNLMMPRCQFFAVALAQKTRTGFFVIIAAIGIGLNLFSFTTLGAEFPAGQSIRPMNVVIILVDDLGWRDTEVTGSRYYRTPHINKLAAEAMRFTQGYASAAVCSPSRAAMLTGKSPARLHITDWIPGGKVPPGSRFTVPDWNHHLNHGEITLATALKARGYVTASIGKWHLGAREKSGENHSPETQGFDFNIAGGHMEKPGSYFWPYGKQNEKLRIPHLAETGGSAGEYLTDRLTQEATRFLESQRHKPFFLYLSHYAVHVPLEAKPDAIQRQAAVSVVDEQNNKVYGAMIRSVDDSVGQIMDKLRSLGLEDRTVVIFTSDNGGQSNLHGPTSNLPLRGCKGHPYEGGLRVPFLIKIPGVTKAGAVSDVPIIGMDVFPTLARLIGFDGKSAMDGSDLYPVLTGGALSRDTLYWHYPHYWMREITPYSVIRSGDWKLIRWHEFDTEELYDLRADPLENHDLVNVDESNRKKLADKLDAWLRTSGAQMPREVPGWRNSDKPRVNPAHAGRPGS